jgi:hypothetical protein
LAVIAALAGVVLATSAAPTTGQAGAASTRTGREHVPSANPARSSAQSTSPSGTRVQRAAAGTPGTHLFGVSIASLSQLPSMQNLSRTLARSMDVIDIYAGWTSPFPTQSVQSVAATGAVPEITWQPWDYRLGTNQNTFPLRSITAGVFDPYVSAWARAAAQAPRPLLLRFAHEMNGTWYPWDVGVNGNTPLDYVNAYRHVRAVFAAAGATNVYWVWSPNVIWRAGTDPTPEYPGADAVDFVGVDGYNPGAAVPGGTWNSPRTVFGATLAAVARFAGTKPIVINETGSSELGGSKAAWIRDFLAYLAAQPKMVGFVWSEYKGRADWPIETSTTSTASMASNLPLLWP